MQKTSADRIKERREALGMTQEQLADKMGFKGKSSVSKIESAGGSLTLKTIEKAAKALNCSTSYLMGWTESTLPVLEPQQNDQIPALEKYDPEEVKRAMELYEKYQNTLPQIREAVDGLLK